ncbi:helix-turn-helix domain-containing protein [Nocardioides plantarum]|uniref:Helix-turn-helix domain-containing protein n=1 Tax=Nocardioides plantarum TaxID=29299 RepID=A0ABV5KI61_9ACTN|nr:helix-turn-helix domain-containing protein [Nocardioides plantarum]
MEPRAERRWAIAHTPDDLGRFLAKRRSELGWKQQELAAHLGIPPRYLHEIEAGKDTLAYTRLFALLRELDVELRLETVPRADTTFGGNEPLHAQVETSPKPPAAPTADTKGPAAGTSAPRPTPDADDPPGGAWGGLVYGHNQAARNAVDAFFHDFDTPESNEPPPQPDVAATQAESAPT